MVRSDEPRKTSPAPTKESGRHEEHDDAPEWRGGNRPQEEARQRSEERGWGAANAGDKLATEEE